MKDRINVKVITGAKQERVKDLGSKIVVYTNEPPEKGRANDSVISQLASFFGVKTYEVKIVRGQTSSHKVIEIDM
ncbi:MAG: DUF167 domain-containing protein [bacterium]